MPHNKSRKFLWEHSAACPVLWLVSIAAWLIGFYHLLWKTPSFVYLQILCSNIVQTWSVSAWRASVQKRLQWLCGDLCPLNWKLVSWSIVSFLPLVNGASWSFVPLCKVKPSVRNCSIGTFLRNTDAGMQVLRNLIRKQQNQGGIRVKQVPYNSRIVIAELSNRNYVARSEASERYKGWRWCLEMP